MIDMRDIRNRIDTDFGDKAAEALHILENAIAKSDHLDDNRIIRCIVFLSQGDLGRLQNNIIAATSDPRDVIYWAEYIHHGKGNPLQRVRDFNNAFGEEDIGNDNDPA